MTEAELLAEIDRANAKIDRTRAAWDRAHDSRSALIERLTAEYGPGPVCTNRSYFGCDEWTQCRTEGVCAYGAPPTEEELREKEAKRLRTQVEKLMDALHEIQKHEPGYVVLKASKGLYDLFIGDAGYVHYRKDSRVKMLEQMRDSKSSPDPTVRPRKSRAPSAKAQAKAQAKADAQELLEYKLRVGGPLNIGERWEAQRDHKAEVATAAFRALMDATLFLPEYDAELVVSSLGIEQYELFMSEVDGYIQTLHALRDVHSLPTRARLEIV